jgi:hypothetical protein
VVVEQAIKHLLTQDLEMAEMDLVAQAQHTFTTVVELVVAVAVEDMLAQHQVHKVEQEEVVAVEQEVVLEDKAMEEQGLLSSTTKMYAVIKNNTVIAPFVGTIDEARDKYPSCKFIAMTLENSPMSVDAILTSKQLEEAI